MDYLRFSISNPVKVSVGVLLLVLAGLISLFTIPVQLVPNVDQPVITVETTWVGIDPEQIEQDILEKQEEVLKRVSGLRKMVSVASRGRGEVTLEFNIGTDMTRALQEVSDKLREVPDYPTEVDQPVITVADAASQNAIAWMIITSNDPEFDVESIRDHVEDRVKPFLERVVGISKVNVYGGRDREVHIEIDPRRLAERGITVEQFRQALRTENTNISAGEVVDGRLDVRVRTVGQYDTIEQVLETVVVQTDGGPVRVRDLADVKETLQKRRSFVRSRGKPAIAMNAIREVGSNVMTTMEELRERLEVVRTDILPHLGPNPDTLTIEQVYDETVYIDDARALVVNNLWMGGTLAVVVLLLFLRSIRPTVIISLAIPISVIGTFVAMRAFGRNLNVVSLAGMSFAVGMVVDNAIVVLENIDRHLGMGKRPRQAAYDAASEVWGAVLASTLTTLAVFVPVLFMEEEAGQLFRDIALAICAAVALSLIVSVTVIPTAAARFAKEYVEPKSGVMRALRSLGGVANVFDGLRSVWANAIHWLTQPNLVGTVARLGIVAAFTLLSVAGAYFLAPPTSYLPGGNRNLVFGMMQTPPAYNPQHIEENIAQKTVERAIRPYWEADPNDPAQVASLPPVVDPRMPDVVLPTPLIDNYFFVTFNNTIFMGGASRDKQNVAPVATLLNNAMASNPGSFGFAFQPPIFGRGMGGANAIEIDIIGQNPETLRAAAAALFGRMYAEYRSVQPAPANFNLPNPELRVEPRRHVATDLNLTTETLGRYVQMLVDGTYVGDYRIGGKSIDMLLVRAPHVRVTTDALEKMPVAFVDRNGQSGTVPLGAVADIVTSESPEQIRRIEERRAVTLTVNPPSAVPLETAANRVMEVVAELRQQGAIAGDVDVQLAGTVDKLQEVRSAMLGEWTGFNLETFKALIMSRMFLALLVTFLLMAALFESYLFPFVIMFSVPLAMVGGFIGLAGLHYFVPTQQLDVLTMLGFVILIGVVVNNAILIVHQALNFMRGVSDTGEALDKALAPREAIRESVRTRIRPIFMTTLTSVFGMLPLVVMPGSGSELYRGLGSVVLGGLVVSTLFTLIVVPLLLSLVIDLKLAFAKLRGVEAEVVPVRVEEVSGVNSGT